MSRTCQICGRGTKASQSRSHSNVATKRKQFINIQTKSIDGKKVKICTKCIKTAAKGKK
ncbi:MAG: 50S ribosomal protein L28 [Candidatus Pacebacteria bacterium]|nr:50S ribosomal protein L28 [Candidatus Paceibacterota bacterium]